MNRPDPLVNVHAEAVLLGGLMLENKLIAEYSDRLKADDFAEPIHQRIFSALLRLNAKGAAANAISMRPIFALDPDSDGGNYLAALVESPAVVAAAHQHLDQVVELAARRRARQALEQGIAQVEDVDVAIGDAVGGVEEGLWAAERSEEDTGLLEQGDLIDRVLDRQYRIETGEQTAGATNALIPDIDIAIGALETRQYVILAGRPGMGKTTLASSAARGYAMNGHCGLYCDTEMSEEQHAMRSVSDFSKVMGRPIPHDAIKAGKLDKGDVNFLRSVRDRANLIPLRYKHVGECSWRRIYSIVAREKARLAALGKKLWFVVIDYLGKLQAEDAMGRPIDDDRKRINAVSKGLKRIADELDVAVIALAQLSREVDKRPDKRPHNADLKESGNLEQDADVIIFAYRDEYYLEQEEPKGAAATDEKGRRLHEEWKTELDCARGKLEMIVGKNRHGSRKTRTLRFDGTHYAVRGSSFRVEEEGMPDFWST